MAFEISELVKGLKELLRVIFFVVFVGGLDQLSLQISDFTSDSVDDFIGKLEILSYFLLTSCGEDAELAFEEVGLHIFEIYVFRENLDPGIEDGAFESQAVVLLDGLNDASIVGFFVFSLEWSLSLISDLKLTFHFFFK